MSKKKGSPPSSRLAEPAAPVSKTLTVLWSGGLVWLLLLCIKFYNTQPFPHSTILSVLFPSNFSLIPTGPTLMNDLIGIFWAVLFFISALFVGRLVLFKFLKDPASALEMAVFSAALGYGILSYAALGLAAAGMISGTVFKVLISALALGGVMWFVRPEEKNLVLQSRKEKMSILFPDGKSTYLSLILIFILTTIFVMTFVPELFYDALVYHLGAPNYYLQAGRLANIDLMTAKFPLTVQMLHMIGLALKDEIVTKITHLTMLTLIVGGMMALGLRMKKPFWGLLSAVLFCSVPTVFLNAMTSGVDVGTSLFAFLAAYAMLVHFESENKTFWLILSGVFTGFALGSKYTTAPMALAIGLTLIIRSVVQKQPVGQIIKQTLIYGVVAIAVVSPWFIKDWAETGNPVYPFMTKLFGGIPLDSWRYENLKTENNGLPLKTLKDFVMMFWNLSTREQSSLSFQGPVFLGLVPFCIYGFLKDRQAWLKNILLLAIIFLPGAVYMTRLTRYWMPGLTMISLLLAFGVAALLEDKSSLKKTSVMLILSLGFLYQISWVYIIIRASYAPQDILLGRTSKYDYISVYHNGMNPNPSLQMYRYLESIFTKEDKVLLVGDEKGYPLHVRHQYSGVYDRGPLVRFADSSSTAEEMAQKLKELGITHLLINMYEANRLSGYGIFNFSQSGFGVFCDFWEKYLVLQHVEQAPLAPGYTNPLLLLKIEYNGRPQNVPPVQNVLVQFYDKVELPRAHLDSNEKQLEFYRQLNLKFPHVEVIKTRLQDLQKSLSINNLHAAPAHK